jgi:cytochrome c553
MQVSLDEELLPADPRPRRRQGRHRRGAATYGAKCASCHGNDGQGRIAQSATLGEQGIFPRLAGQPAAYLYRQLWSFAHGWRASAAMPPMADGLTETDWADIAVHLEHLTATAYPPPPVYANDLVELGRSIATLGRPDRGVSPCSHCHGPAGIGVAPYFPALMGLDTSPRRSSPFVAGNAVTRCCG